jgi:AraC-like DNA-binding protein
LPRTLLDALQAAGMDPRQLAARLGLAPDTLEAGMTFADADRVLCAAWEARDDPAAGIQAGTMLRPERFGIVGLAAMASPTFGVAVERKARYWRLIWGDAYQVKVRGDERHVVLMPSGPGRNYTQGKIDMELASLVTFGRRFTGVPIRPLRLLLVQDAPPWREVYQQVFDCPLHFGASENALVFARSDFELPLVSRNAEVEAVVAGGVEAALLRMNEEAPSVRGQVGAVVDRLLAGDEPTLSVVAGRMHRSARTLQRQLADEGLRFTDVLDERRREAGERHLAASSATAEEVAFLLGFATPSSFFRAFKRWTGTTPDAWRRERQRS